MYDYNLSLSGVSLLLSILIFCYALCLRRRMSRQSGILSQQTEYFEAVQDRLQDAEIREAREKSFQQDLQQAEVTTELQKPRGSFGNTRNQRAPERYQYATSMFRSGMNKEEISTALGMSLHELSQLLILSNLCNSKKCITQAL
jgi:hypothetical protein